ncbi:MAG: GNAT family N-acetyltransferase [bacterium]
MDDRETAAVLVDELEGDAAEDLFVAAGADAGRLRLAHRAVAGGARLLGCGAVDHSLVNRAIGLGSARQAVADVQEAVDRWLAEGGGERLWLDLPATIVSAWRPWLDRRGAVSTGVGRHLLAHDGALPPVIRSGIEVARAARDEAAAVSALLARGFGLQGVAAAILRGAVWRPRWHVFVGRVDGRRIAAASLFVSGDRAFLGPSATVPAARRRGAHFTLTAIAIRAALDLGCRTLVTSVPDAGSGDGAPVLRNLERLGFRCFASTRGFAVAAGGVDAVVSLPRHAREARREFAHVAHPRASRRPIA